MIRIHPIPRRYMDVRFKNFQWIRARVSKHPHDPRPESYRIDPESIELKNEIPSKKSEERRAILESSPHVFSSVEELKKAYETAQTSMGIVRPKRITNLRITMRSKSARAEWLETEKKMLAQRDLYERPPMRIDFPEARFMVGWICDDKRCSGHEMGLEQWGLHELYRKYRGRADCEDKVLSEMQRRLDDKKYDIFLFLGNFRGVMYNFGLMDSYNAKKVQPKPQLSLLEG